MKDIEIEDWGYDVYFENSDGITRHVFNFNSEAEAQKLVEMIRNRGYRAWHKFKCKLVELGHDMTRA